MPVVREGNLEFTFGSTWRVLKYDDGAFYRTQMANKVSPSKAVDFLCLCDGQPLLVLEVKDFSLGVPPLEKFDKVPVAVAVKTRDTIAGIVGGSYCASNGAERSFFHDSRNRMTDPPRVIYFFEDLATPARKPRGRAENKRSVLLNRLKEHLRWLTKDVAVVGLNDYAQFIADLTIRRVVPL